MTMEKEAKRIGILFGGAFDPIHLGHIQCIQCAADTVTSPTTLTIMPSAYPPHRDRAGCALEHRVTMIKKALTHVKTSPDFAIEISAYEAHNHTSKTPSYTIDTLNELKDEKNIKVLLLGSDNALTFHTWHRYTEILEQVEIWCVRREDISEDHVHAICQEKWPQKYWDKLKVLKGAFKSISSTDIKASLHRNEDISQYVPLNVWEYIKEKGLYIAS